MGNWTASGLRGCSLAGLAVDAVVALSWGVNATSGNSVDKFTSASLGVEAFLLYHQLEPATTTEKILH